MNIIHFMIKEIRMCCDLQYINKIILLPQLDIIPNCPFDVAGVMNVANISVPVIDLTLRLNLQRSQPYTLDTPILLCHYENQYLGIIIDSVIGLDYIENKNIQRDTSLQGSVSPLLGSIALHNELTFILNIEKIFSTIEEVAL